MLSLIGKDETIRNIYRLARVHDQTSELTDVTQLRSAYLSTLAANQPHMIVNPSSSPFVDDVGAEEKLAGAFRLADLLNDMHEGGVIGEHFEAEVKHARIDRARSALRSLRHASPDVRLIFDLAVHSIFVQQSSAHGFSAHGGTSSAAIGAIWMTLRDSISENDIKEMLIHELTHTLLFVDELSHTHFNYPEIAKHENYAFSSILLRRRPLDKVVHSIVVATEILLARARFLGEPDDLTVHPRSPSLASSTLTAIGSLYELGNIHELASTRLLNFVEMCKAVCDDVVSAESEAA